MIVTKGPFRVLICAFRCLQRSAYSDNKIILAVYRCYYPNYLISIMQRSLPVIALCRPYNHVIIPVTSRGQLIAGDPCPSIPLSAAGSNG